MIFDDSLLFKSLSELSVIDKGLLDDAFEQSKELDEPLSELLLQRDLISDENLGVIIADIMKVPFVRLEKVSLDREILEIIPEEMARARGVILFKADEEGTHVAMKNPHDLVSVSFLKKKIEGKLVIHYATERDIRSALFSYRRDVSAVFEEIINKSVGEIHQESDVAPIIKIAETMLVYAYQSRASDIHVEPMEDSTQVRFRIDGVLHDVIALPKNLEEQLVSRIKIMSSLPTDEHSSALDGKFEFEIPDMERIDVRVSILPATNGERVVMRILAGNIQ